MKGNEINGEWEFELFKESNNPDKKDDITQPEPKTVLGKFLNGLKAQKGKDLSISEAVYKALLIDELSCKESYFLLFKE
ncbi:hypothetical protein [Runella slithyformis]|uniref:hypothetical protein n=1 Tax=Runella slithyformis TaxID=106 RepID=UPI000315CC9E|nr:hypothetical protein [Runella slithyformis]